MRSLGRNTFGNIFDKTNSPKIKAEMAAQAQFKKNAASDRAANAKQGNPKPVMSLVSAFETVGSLGSAAKQHAKKSSAAK
jgi:hypothetical protein